MGENIESHEKCLINKRIQHIDPVALRGQAEELLRAKTDELHPPLSAEASRRLVHELQVHQIELEMQNAELRRTQEELDISRNKYAELYAELYDFAPVGYFTFDPQGVIRAANLTGAQLLGTERGLLADKPFSRFIADSGGREIFSQHLKNVLQRHGLHRCEIRLTGKDGSIIHGQLQSVMVDDSDCKDGYILSSIVDGTVARHLGAEIQDAREYAESIVETVREPLIVLNSDLKILTANRSFYETFKVTPEETIGNFIYDVGNRQWDIIGLRVLFEEILPHDTVINGYEVEHDFPGIGRKTILLNARQIFRKKISSRIILLAFEDITDRKRAEAALIVKRQAIEDLNRTLEKRIASAVDELLQKNQMLILQERLAFMGEMINNIAHQWRQPLNILSLNLQYLPLTYGSAEFNREFLESSVAKSMQLITHMSQTIEDFMGFFKPDRQEETFRVDRVIRKTISLIEDYFKVQMIRIVFHADGEPSIKGYPNEYAQVLLNLLSNARDALVEHKIDDAIISINAFSEGDKTVITITDNAGGIADENIAGLFNPFFTTKGPNKGTGIGLYMSKTIIEKNMGGSLKVRNVGSGAEFRIEVMA